MSCCKQGWGARLMVLLASVVLSVSAIAETAEPGKEKWLKMASQMIKPGNLVKTIVGIDNSHPRYKAFETGYANMFQSRVIMNSIYDAISENALLLSDEDAVRRFTQEWAASIGRRGMQRLDSDDLVNFLRIRQGYYASISREECGAQLKEDRIDNKMFYRWLATRSSDRPVIEFFQIIVEALEREIQEKDSREVTTDSQLKLGGELLFERLARTEGQDHAAAIALTIAKPKSVSNVSLCDAALLFWKSALEMRGEPRRWAMKALITP